MWDIFLFLVYLPFALIGIGIILYAVLCTWVVTDAVFSQDNLTDEDFD